MDEEFEIIRSLEIELAQPAIRKDSARLSALLSEDFEEIGKSGNTYSKSEIIRTLRDEELAEIKISDFIFNKLSDKAVLVKYISISNGTKAYRSSVWIKSDNEWRMLHHQGTQFE